MAFRSLIENTILPLVAKPNRYIGNFVNARPGRFSAASVRAVVVHPEVFEAGLTDRETRAAYAVLNEIPGVAADLAFLPWPDLAGMLAERRLPLWGLESFAELSSFDLVLFTPGSALQYASMLRMLSISGIPLAASERGGKGGAAVEAGRTPLICAVGAPLGNPLPLSPFLDAVFLGEGEAVLPAAVEALKRAGAGRAARLEALANVPGVLLFTEDDGRARDTVAAAVIATDRLAPRDPGLLPLIESGHDGLALEIRRGGTPLRCEGGWRAFDRAWEMPVEMAIERAESGLSRTGFDRIDLTGDMPWKHGALLPLVENLVRRHAGIRLVLPDFGVAEPSPALAREILRGRRSAFQWSPLAGTARLRRVLNHEFDQTRFLEAVGVALRGGCHLVRLRFGIGWPTETDEDLKAIGDLVRKVRSLASAGGVPRIQVQLEPFVPRPHSPFQWEAMPDLSEMARRIGTVRNDVEHGPVQVRAVPPEQSLVEAVLSRGGPELAPALLEAMARGATSPHAAEQWNPAPWLEALAAARIDIDAAIAARPVGEPLPWSRIEAGLPAVVLAEERLKGLAGELTSPGLLEAAAHGIVVDVAPILPGPAAGETLRGTPDVAFGRTSRRRAGSSPASRQARRFRLRFSKGDPVRFTAHLDVARAFERAVRRLASAPGVFKGRGFKLSFGPPLPLGMTSDDEYLDLTFTEDVPETALAQIAELLPEALKVEEIRPVRSSAESLCQSIDVADYLVSFPGPIAETIGAAGPAIVPGFPGPIAETIAAAGPAIVPGFPGPIAETIGAAGPAIVPAHRPALQDGAALSAGPVGLREKLEAGVARALAAREIIVVAGGEDAKPVDARPSLLAAQVIELEDGSIALKLRLAVGLPGNQRPEALLPALTGSDFDPRLARIHRQALRISGAGKEFSPLEVVELDFPWWRETLRKRAVGQKP